MASRRTLLFFVVTLATLVGCEDAFQNDGMVKAKRMLSAMEGLSDTMASIKDPESARAAMPNIEYVFTEYADALDEIATYERKNGQIHGLKSDIEKLKKGLANSTKDIELHGRRLSRIKGLPADFWEVYRTQQAIFLIKVLEAGPNRGGNRANEAMDKAYLVRNLFVEHGPSKTVEIALSGFTFRSGSKDTIEKLTGVLESEASVIEIDDDSSGKILVMGPTDKYDELLTLTRELGNVTFEDRPRRIIEFTIDSSQDPSSRRLAERHADSKSSAFERMESMRNRTGSRNKSQTASDMLSRVKSDKLETESSEEYLERLIDALEDDHSFIHRDAKKKLARLKPSKVKNKQHKQRIARAFRSAVRDSNRLSRNSEDLQGLLNWAGKHSVPILIEKMAEEELKISPIFFDSLAKYPTPEGARAVAEQLGNFFNHKAAVSCLRKMGPTAESTLIAVAPSDNPDTVSYTHLTLPTICSV